MNQPAQLTRLQLDFTAGCIAEGWEEDDRIIPHPVSVHDVINVCTNIFLGNGLLPPNTLFWKQKVIGQPRRLRETGRMNPVPLRGKPF